MGIIGNRGQQKIFDGLTDKQRVFCLEYAWNLSPLKAAQEARYRSPGVAGAKLLNKPKIKAAIKALLKPKMALVDLTTDTILLQLRRFLFRDITPYLNSDGRLNCEIEDLPDDIRQAIDGITVSRTYDKSGNMTSERVEVKCVSKESALSQAMKYLGMISENNVNVNVGALDWAKLYAEAREPVVDSIRDRVKEPTDR